MGKVVCRECVGKKIIICNCADNIDRRPNPECLICGGTGKHNCPACNGTGEEDE